MMTQTWRDFLPSPDTQLRTTPAPRFLEWGVFSIGCLASILLILFFSTNVFVLDEWDSAYLLFSKLKAGLFWEAFWSPHNSHRHVLPKFGYYLLAQLPVFELRYLLILSQFLLWLSTLPMLRMFDFTPYPTLKPEEASPSETSPKQRWLPWLIGLVLCGMLLSPVHYTNQLMSLQLSFYLSWVGMIYATYCLSQPTLTAGHLGGAILAALIAYLGSSAGLIVLINTLLILGLRALQEPRTRWHLAGWGLGTGIAAWLYLQNYQSTAQLSFLAEQPLVFVQHTFALLAQVVGTTYAPTATGVGVIGFLCWVYFLVKRYFRGNLFAYGLTQFGLGSAVAVSLQNAAVMGTKTALASHYALFTTCFWIGLLIIGIRIPVFRWGLLVFLSLLVLNTAYKSQWAFERHVSNTERGQVCYHEVLKNPEAVNVEVLPYRDCKFLGPIEYPKRTVDLILKVRNLGIAFPPPLQLRSEQAP